MICPECGTTNARFARSCTKCNASLPKTSVRRLFLGAAAFLVAIAAALLLWQSRFKSQRNDLAGLSAEEREAWARAAAESFDFDLPGGEWEEEDGGALGIASSEVHVARSLLRKEGLAYGVVLVEPVPLSAKGLAALALERLATRSQSFSLSRELAIQLAGENAEQAEFSLESSGIEIRYLATYAVRNGVGYQILFWCVARDFPAFRIEFDKALSSWEWKEKDS